jgi:prepilin-type N-terminal cleavage/methylation domain-containing protein
MHRRFRFSELSFETREILPISRFVPGFSFQKSHSNTGRIVAELIEGTHPMRNIRTARRGFTLIEILIVVVILGILASIVIPQFTNASDQAAASQARTQLQSMRSQCQLYRAQNSYLPSEDVSDPDGMASAEACFNALVAAKYIPQAPTLSGEFTWSLSDDATRLVIIGNDSNGVPNAW